MTTAAISPRPHGRLGGRDRLDVFVEFGVDLRFVDCVRKAQGALERAIAAFAPVEVFSLLFLALVLLALAHVKLGNDESDDQQE